MLLTPVAIGVALAAVVVRRRRASGVQREQMRWLVYAVVVVAVGWTISIVLGVLGVEWGLVPAVLTLGPLALLPIAITIAIVQYRLYDIDLIINRTLVYGGLTGIVLAAYAALVLVVTAATGSEVAWRGSVLVVVAVALLAYPLREWLQGSVNRLMYGDRDDPARALALLSRRVGDALTPDTLLPAVAEAVRQALRVPHVAITLTGQDAPAASSGDQRGEEYPVDLIHQGQHVGRLAVGVRPGGDFVAADLRLLQDIAPQVAVAAHAVLLTADLQTSRERLVLAREEERRRLRRDLHDGVGSELAGLALVAGNARNALPDDPAQAQRWVVLLEEGIRATVGDIRRIVDDLRPPALDELGLADALQERADVLVPGARVYADGLADAALPAAVEVAAYRIATEALTNAARHAAAHRVTVQLGIQERPYALVAAISDDGRGIDASARPGVGLASMRDRAAELGGSCQVSAGPTGGTTVRAVLPIANHSQEAAGG
jgi:signal transduction histidine kinase